MLWTSQTNTLPVTTTFGYKVYVQEMEGGDRRSTCAPGPYLCVLFLSWYLVLASGRQEHKHYLVHWSKAVPLEVVPGDSLGGRCQSLELELVGLVQKKKKKNEHPVLLL